MGLYGQSFRFGLGAGLTSAVKYLIIANVACFVLQHVLPQEVVAWFQLVPVSVIHDFTLWQLASYMFLHGSGIWHILINMLVLWMFGCELEREWGSKAFLLYYFVCGIGAGLFHVLLGIDSAIPVVGASGAIYGLLMAFGMLFPERMITFLIFFILPVQIKAKYLVMIIAGISLFSGIFDPNSGVAHFAHLGGMIVGFLFLKMDWRWAAMRRSASAWMDPDYAPPTYGKPARGVSALKDWFRRRKQKKHHMEVVRRRQHEMNLRERVDVILDKINEVGYDHLTLEEKEILKRASQFLGKENIRSQDFGPN